MVRILLNNIFIHQINHNLNIIKLKIDFYYKWNNVNDNFTMPLDLLVNGKELKNLPTKEYQSFEITKHSQIEVMDWKFYVLPKRKYLINFLFLFLSFLFYPKIT